MVLFPTYKTYGVVGLEKTQSHAKPMTHIPISHAQKKFDFHSFNEGNQKDPDEMAHGYRC